MTFKTEGFILKTYDFREKSKIAYFYTREFGKIKGILKGIEENKKNFPTHLQPSSKNEIIFYPSRSDLHLISRCDLIEDFPSIRNNLKRMVISNCFLELIDNIMPLEEANIPIFNLLGFSLNALNKGFDIDLLWIFFQIKALKLAGFRPQLNFCLLCEKEIKDWSIYFSLNLGGLICWECKDRDRDAKRLLKGTLASLIYIDKSNPERLYSFKIDRKIKSELQDLLKIFIQYHLEREIKSERLLEVA